uniref:Uncharacterized protein n=1 Tax=Glossina austeni TaxID=7395 RepID=A0A1A9VUS9_GLOAU
MNNQNRSVDLRLLKMDAKSSGTERRGLLKRRKRLEYRSICVCMLCMLGERKLKITKCINYFMNESVYGNAIVRLKRYNRFYAIIISFTCIFITAAKGKKVLALEL